MINNYKLKPGSGDEVTLSEMTLQELQEEKDFWNRTLKDKFFENTGTYDHAAHMIREIDDELMRRGDKVTEPTDNLWDFVMGIGR